MKYFMEDKKASSVIFKHYWPKTLFENSTYGASFSFIFSNNRTQQKHWHDLNLRGNAVGSSQLTIFSLWRLSNKP